MCSKARLYYFLKNYKVPRFVTPVHTVYMKALAVFLPFWQEMLGRHKLRLSNYKLSDHKIHLAQPSLLVTHTPSGHCVSVKPMICISCIALLCWCVASMFAHITWHCMLAWLNAWVHMCIFVSTLWSISSITFSYLTAVKSRVYIWLFI